MEGVNHPFHAFQAAPPGIAFGDQPEGGEDALAAPLDLGQFQDEAVGPDPELAEDRGRSRSEDDGRIRQHQRRELLIRQRWVPPRLPERRQFGVILP